MVVFGVPGSSCAFIAWAAKSARRGSARAEDRAGRSGAAGSDTSGAPARVLFPARGGGRARHRAHRRARRGRDRPRARGAEDRRAPLWGRHRWSPTSRCRSATSAGSASRRHRRGRSGSDRRGSARWTARSSPSRTASSRRCTSRTSPSGIGSGCTRRCGSGTRRRPTSCATCWSACASSSTPTRWSTPIRRGCGLVDFAVHALEVEIFAYVRTTGLQSVRGRARGHVPAHYGHPRGERHRLRAPVADDLPGRGRARSGAGAGGRGRGAALAGGGHAPDAGVLAGARGAAPGHARVPRSDDAHRRPGRPPPRHALRLPRSGVSASRGPRLRSDREPDRAGDAPAQHRAPAPPAAGPLHGDVQHRRHLRLPDERRLHRDLHRQPLLLLPERQRRRDRARTPP